MSANYLFYRSNKDTKLIEFIRKNYKENEKYFDTALKNELSFLISAL